MVLVKQTFTTMGSGKQYQFVIIERVAKRNGVSSLIGKLMVTGTHGTTDFYLAIQYAHHLHVYYTLAHTRLIFLKVIHCRGPFARIYIPIIPADPVDYKQDQEQYYHGKYHMVKNKFCYAFDDDVNHEINCIKKTKQPYYFELSKKYGCFTFVLIIK